MISDAVLDHVAIAAEHQRVLVPRYVDELGGRFMGYGEGPGFSPLQVQYTNGAKIELLRPAYVEINDFLARFLEQRGPGPHHLTFKVPDIVSAIDNCTSAGFEVINVDLSSEHWKEAFLHPKTAHGILVQLAQAAGDMPVDPPEWFPTAQPRHDTALVRVLHAVASLDDALALFRDVLGGRTVVTGADRGSWHELAWGDGSGLNVRLWQPDDVAAVVGGQPGRLVRLEFAVPGAASELTIAAGDNHGVELLLLPG